MKSIKHLLTALLLAGLTAGALNVRADDKPADKKAKPYPLTTCVVSGEKIDPNGDMKPHSFVHEGQEITLCCKGCLKDFNKDKAKYLKKIADAAKKGK